MILFINKIKINKNKIIIKKYKSKQKNINLNSKQIKWWMTKIKIK